jgi:hypothetical protein
VAVEKHTWPLTPSLAPNLAHFLATLRRHIRLCQVNSMQPAGRPPWPRASEPKRGGRSHSSRRPSCQAANIDREATVVEGPAWSVRGLIEPGSRHPLKVESAVQRPAGLPLPGVSTGANTAELPDAATNRRPAAESYLRAGQVPVLRSPLSQVPVPGGRGGERAVCPACPDGQQQHGLLTGTGASDDGRHGGEATGRGPRTVTIPSRRSVPLPRRRPGRGARAVPAGQAR